MEPPGGITGFAWEADAVARSLRDGSLECERMSWRESVLQMEVSSLSALRRRTLIMCTDL